MLGELLRACTTKASFRSPDGKLHHETDGLGVTFADHYMSHKGNLVLANDGIRPATYYRNVDDIYVGTYTAAAQSHARYFGI